MPFIDTNPKGNGYFTIRERPFALATWLFGFLILWVVLIFFGTFLRGPNWNFFGPFEFWDAHKVLPLNNVNLSDYFWLPLGVTFPEGQGIGGILLREGPYQGSNGGRTYAQGPGDLLRRSSRSA